MGANSVSVANGAGRVGALVGLAGLALCAIAAPQEQVTFTNVDSEGELGQGVNEVRTRAFTGGYTASKLRVTGVLESIDPLTFASDSRIRITSANGAVTDIQPSNLDSVFETTAVTDVVFNLTNPGPAAGTWSFRFYEFFADAFSGPDASWVSITLTLDDQGQSGPVVLPPVSGRYTEVEDNDRKGRSNIIESLKNNEIISGGTLGSSDQPGPQSLDYFDIRTETAPAGIYRHQLTISGQSIGISGSIRGLTQDEGVINPASDAEVQPSALMSGGPDRQNVWYGFGKGERLYYRTSGTSASTQGYEVTYTRTPVQAFNTGNPFQAGAITISTFNSGHTTDTDFWVYDAQFNAIPGYGSDDLAGQALGLSEFSGQFQAGVYYIALSLFNLANDQPSTYSLEGFRDGNVMDFPDSVMRFIGTGSNAVGFSIRDSSGTRAFDFGNVGPFEVQWIRFEVAPAACPADLDDGSVTGVPDGAVDINDLLYFLTFFELGDVRVDLDNDGDPSEGVPDQAVDINDLLFFLARFESGC